MAASASDIVAVYGNQYLDHGLATKIVSVANQLGMPDPAMLANVINFESNGFNPQAVNPYSGATGLIQFMPTTASELGTSTGALRGMSAIRQMDYVKSYFQLPRVTQYGPLNTQLDVYMAVFYPKAIGKGPAYVFPPNVQVNNPGIFTAGHYAAKANLRALMTPTEAIGYALAATVVVSVVGAGLIWWAFRYRQGLPLLPDRLQLPGL